MTRNQGGSDQRGEPEVPEFILDPDDGDDIPRGWIVAAAFLGVIALVAGVVGVANLGSGGPTDTADGAELIDNDDPTRPTLADLAPAGPRDGLESHRLPVTVEPAQDLVDGQVVTVSGAGFPPDTPLGVVMCSGAIDLGGGSAQCQLSPYTPVNSDAEGNFSVEHQMRRVIVVGGEAIDCASQQPGGTRAPTGELLPSTCVVAVGAIADYDQSGVFPVEFDESVPPPEPPSATVTPSDGLVDGDIVTVTVNGVDADWGTWPSICTNLPDASDQRGTFVQIRPGPTQDHHGESWCEPFGGRWPELLEPTSTFQAPISRWFGTMSGLEPIDCGESPGRCWIEVHTYPLSADPVPLSFDPSVPPPPPPPPPTDEWDHRPETNPGYTTTTTH